MNIKRMIVSALAALSTGAVFAAINPYDFEYGVELTLNRDLHKDAATNGVPALVRLGEGVLNGFHYSDFQLGGGADLVFLDQDGQEIPHEIDTWDTTGESLVWVKLPSTASGTKITMCWGKGGRPALPSTDVWSDYVGVWHLSESGGPNAAVTVKDATANGYDGVTRSSAEGLTSEGRFGNGWQIASTAKAKTGGILMESMKEVALGVQFTVSAWAYHSSSTYYWDHLFYRKNSGSESGGFSSEINNGTKGTLHAYGGANGKAALTIPDTCQKWAHIAVTWDGNAAYSFCDGVAKGSQPTNTAPTDNGKAIAFGTDSDANDQNWIGTLDELRIRKGAYDENYLTAEYAAMNIGESDIFTFGEVYHQDTTAPTLAEPVAVVHADGSVTISVVITDNVPRADSVKAVVNGMGYGMTADGTTLPQTWSATIPAGTFVVDKQYAYSVACTSTGGSAVSRDGAPAFYTGVISLEKTADADEKTLTPGAFTVSRVDTEHDWLVNYTVSGTAVAGGSYVGLSGSVVIPAGETSAQITVKPLYDESVTEDVSVVVTLSAGSFILPERTSATVVIVNSDVNPFVRHVSPDGNDENEGFLETLPKKTIQAALASLETASQTEPCTVYLADGVYPFTSETGPLRLTNAIAVVGNHLDPSAVVFTNQSFRSSSLVWMNHANAFLGGVTVTKGWAPQSDYNGMTASQVSRGGNIRIEGAGGMVSNCIVTAGHADNYHGRGGNIFMESDNAHVTHCVIAKGYINDAGGGSKGGGIHMENGHLSHSLVAENYETTSGNKANIVAGVWIKKGSIVNCTIAANKGKTCGGVYVDGTAAIVKNCVIAGNESSTTGGDTVAYAVSADAAKGCFVSCALDTATVPGDSCISASSAELLASVDDGDYTLAAGSPAIDAGATLENPPMLDLAGDPRVRGNAIDLGCYESDPTALAVAFETDKTRGILPQDVAFTATVTGLAEGETVVSYEWDFDGDGTFEDPIAVAGTVHPYSIGGIYTVALKVTTSAGRSLTVTKHDLLQFSQRVLYVDAASANPVASYASWETAATTLADAVAAAVDGCEIVIRKGVYPISSRVIVEKDLTIHGETERPKDVVLAPPNKNKDVLTVNSPLAKVSGVTISDAWSIGGAGPAVYFGVAGGMVSNCVIRNSHVSNWAGNGVVCFNGAGILTHSVISNCHATSYCNGTKYIVQMYGSGHLEHSLIYGNYSTGNLNAAGTQSDDCAALLFASASAVVRNNTIVGNKIGNRGLLKLETGATFVNNVLAQNEFVASGDSIEGQNKTDFGFNFGSSNGVEGLPVYVNCAFDATCGFGDAAPNETCVLGTATGFFKDFAAGDYRPKAGGPLVNKGRDYDDLPAVDLAGKPRKSGKVDIGCHEAASFFMVIVR